MHYHAFGLSCQNSFNHLLVTFYPNFILKELKGNYAIVTVIKDKKEMICSLVQKRD